MLATTLGRMIWSYINKIYLCKQYFVVQFKEPFTWCSELVKSKVKSDLNVNPRMRTEIDLNECEHFLKTDLDRSEIDLSQKRFECEFLNANLYMDLNDSEIDLNECENFLRSI